MFWDFVYLFNQVVDAPVYYRGIGVRHQVGIHEKSLIQFRKMGERALKVGAFPEILDEVVGPLGKVLNRFRYIRIFEELSLGCIG